jgi:hypothetical protein
VEFLFTKVLNNFPKSEKAFLMSERRVDAKKRLFPVEQAVFLIFPVSPRKGKIKRQIQF